jgi:hypothetical protein
MRTRRLASGRAGEIAETEPTEAGQQCLVSGVRPIGPSDQLAFLAAAPVAATKLLRRADFELFDMNVRK